MLSKVKRMEISSLHKQVLVASADSWNSVNGKLHCYEDSKQLYVFDIVFGNNGLAKEGEKVEGDGKSPVGIFKLGKIYGKEVKLDTQMDYEQIAHDLEAVDDPESKYYNQIVRKSEILDFDWKSSEKMGQIDIYDIVIHIEYNWPQVQKRRGSAIFMHRWSVPGRGTGGCIGLDARALALIIAWLDPTKNPAILIKRTDSRDPKDEKDGQRTDGVVLSL